ncbi:glycoside hydrolase family 127 protein [Fontisphaera persica]|uniref:beta-L-arabinofuranosidase domain-containing protein n=1 Tax=Fontisphaera persica TaxID=2974023 RepID=UPI0024C04713|nr:beta-L-arabinofuranosidase domain-containing protein [Fontisphaera persica]WCJ60345.1 glycoside hydrolase family 127 protein [Fontisphaera persica]
MHVPFTIGNGQRLTLVLLLSLCAGATLLSAAPAVTAVVRESPATQEQNPWYTSSRAPLRPVPFLKLPIGSIQPRGWLRHQLELSRDGMVGRLGEISPWLRKEGHAWLARDGRGHSAWEELPYWLKGYGDLGYVLQDQTIIQEARVWIEAMLASQDDTGWFGPRELQKSLQGRPDLWPHMVMLNVLQSYHEYSGDPRVLACMTRYFRWLHQQPPETFSAGYWPKMRWGDNLESVYWLYNRTGDAFLLELARKIFENMQDWTTGVHNWHNVNIAQGFRTPAIFYLQSGSFLHRNAAELNYRQVMDLYGQFPGGGFVGDENCRRGYIDPRGGIETCGIVEFTHSFQMLTRLTGDPIWAERCEEIAFNSFPAALTPDHRALHYITSANQVQLDRHNKAPGIQNSGTMFSYSPFEVYRCCQHNVSHGWPYYAEELWLATADGGLCASLYADCDVKARVGRSGQEVTVQQRTDYPFSDTVTFTLHMAGAINFPLYLRLPAWCRQPTVSLNGRPVPFKAPERGYLVLQRTWQSGDTVVLRLPMHLRVRTWQAQKNAVSVDYGPLSFSLQIGERWEKYGNRHPQWPEWEVFPTTAWNYGLDLPAHNPAAALELVRRPGPLPKQPWTPENAPLLVRAPARKIPAWKMDVRSMVNPLQASPARTTEPLETVTLIPMGAARLRIACFPTVTTTGGYEWVAPQKPKPSPYKPAASHVNPSDTLEALNDGLEPSNSNDHDIPRFTWWDHRGTQEWVEYIFDKPRRISGVAVYWFDDTGVGQCRVPTAWRVLHRANGQWLPVNQPSPAGVRRDTWDEVKFDAVTTDGLRLEVQLQPKYSGGILEWKVLETP